MVKHAFGRNRKVVSEFMNIFKCQIMKTRSEEQECFHGKSNVNKPSDSDSHAEESWVSWDS